MSLLQPTHIKFGWRKKTILPFPHSCRMNCWLLIQRNKTNLWKYIDLKN